MKIRRPDFDIEIGDLSANPSLDHVVPGLIWPRNITLRRVLALGCTANGCRAQNQDENGQELYRISSLHCFLWEGWRSLMRPVHRVNLAQGLIPPVQRGALDKPPGRQVRSSRR